MDEPQAIEWLSEARYRRFKAASGGDHRSTLDLYEWHAVLAMACFGLIHHFEVLVRNAIDRVLGEGQAQAPLRRTWLLDCDVLEPNGVRQVIGAVERLRRGGPVTRSRIVARLPLSFWAGLFGHRYEALWRRRLRLAFPNGAGARRDVSGRLRRIQVLRNRIAHHDSLLGLDVEALIEDMLEVAAWIDPQARAWLESQTGARQIARQLSRFTPLGAQAGR